jgi:hypothetical protein
VDKARIIGRARRARFVTRRRHLGVHDDKLGTRTLHEVEQLDVPDRVVVETEAENHVELRVLSQELERVASDEAKARRLDSVVGKRCMRVVDELLPRLYANDVRGTGLECGKRPAAVVARNVQEAAAGEARGVAADDRLVAAVEPLQLRTRPAGLAEAVELVEEAHPRLSADRRINCCRRRATIRVQPILVERA